MSARRPGLAACVMYTEWYQGVAYRPAVRRNVEPEYRHPIQAQGRLMWSMMIRSQGQRRERDLPEFCQNPDEYIPLE
jgi:hypothetical protein